MCKLHVGDMESVMIEAADLHCPFKKHAQKKVLPPWLSADIIEMIHDRDRLYKLAKRRDLPNDWAKARRARNLCNKGVRIAKKQFVQSELKKHDKSPREFWQVIEKTW